MSPELRASTRNAVIALFLTLAVWFMPSRDAHAQGVAEEPAAVRFELSYPELAAAVGFDAIAFPPLSPTQARELQSSAVADYPFLPGRFGNVSNHYILYSRACLGRSWKQTCHYLEVAGGFGGAIHRFYGPNPLPSSSPGLLPRKERAAEPLRKVTELREEAVEASP
jgi:hypothetical protein